MVSVKWPKPSVVTGPKVSGLPPAAASKVTRTSMKGLSSTPSTAIEYVDGCAPEAGLQTEVGFSVIAAGVGDGWASAGRSGASTSPTPITAAPACLQDTM